MLNDADASGFKKVYLAMGSIVYISTDKMAIVLGVSTRTIKWHIKEMDNVCYVGRGI